MQVFIWISVLAVKYLYTWGDSDGSSPLVDFVMMCIPGYISSVTASSVAPFGKNIAAVIWLGVLIAISLMGFQIDHSPKLMVPTIAILLGVILGTVQAFAGNFD